jgi:hypothetical protein
MSVREAIGEVLNRLGDQDLHQVLTFARFVEAQKERDEWDAVGLQGLAAAYADDEPEYSLRDLR